MNTGTTAVSTTTAAAAAAAASKSDGKLSKEDLMRRRNKNRLNARRSRERKRLVMDTLQQEHWQMTQANQKIKDENSSLRAAIAAIKHLKDAQSSSSSSQASNADDAPIIVQVEPQKQQQRQHAKPTQSSLPTQQQQMENCSTAIQQLQKNNGTNPPAHQRTTMTPLLFRSAAMLHAQKVLRERQSNRSQMAEPPAPPSTTPVEGPLASYLALQAMQQQVASGAPSSRLQPAALNNSGPDPMAAELLTRQVQPALNLGLLSDPTILQQISLLAQAAIAQSGSSPSSVQGPDLTTAAAAIGAFSVLLQSQMGPSPFNVGLAGLGQQVHPDSPPAQFSFPTYQAPSPFQSASRVSSESDQDDNQSRSCASPEL